VKHAVTDITTK